MKPFLRLSMVSGIGAGMRIAFWVPISVSSWVC